MDGASTIITVILTALIFVFGILFSIIGYFANITLKSIKESIENLWKEIGVMNNRILSEHDSNIKQDERIDMLMELHPSSNLTLEKGKTS